MYKLIFIIAFLVHCPLVYGNTAESHKLKLIFERFFIPLQSAELGDEQQQAKTLLGKTLFYDPRLSQNGEYSCNDCHDLKNYGTNGALFLDLKSKGTISRDVPSLYNKAGLTLFGWTGEHQTLEAYIHQALLSPNEMGNKDITGILSRINQVEAYQVLINNAFENRKLTELQLTQALVHFINGLVTPAPIDAFMSGDNHALTSEQVTGGLLFDSQYCHSCHTGTNLGGRMIQKMGVKESWPNQADLGLYHGTQKRGHKMFFRVSTLRNIEKTAPYFHDASSKRMWDAVKKMARYELGHDMALKDALSIQEFFRALTGKIPNDYIKKPSIPN